jgi:STE24 endopeptidase
MDWSQFFYWAIIAFIIVDFAIGIWLTRLSIKASRWPVPKVLEGLYDDEKYRKQQAYSGEKRRMGLITSSLSMIISLAFFAFGGFAWLDGVVRTATESDVLRAVLFFGFFFVVEFIINLPFSIYSTFSIEERYGFNKSTPRLFAADAVKGFLLNAILNGGLLALAAWIYTLNPKWFWLIAFGVFTTFTLFFTYFYSELIVPLFNKQTPLEEGELRDAIESFAAAAGFQLENIYVMDESKRTTKANAYFTGFGKKKRVVLFDTLIQQLTTDEIVGVLAHEIGHYKRHHLVKGMVSAAVESLILFWVVSLVLGSKTIAAAAGCAEPSFWINVQVFAMLLAPLGLVQGLIDNAVSRKHEREADDFAFSHGCSASEASALKKMAAQALSNLTPHPVVVKFEYSHPTLAERVECLEKNSPVVSKDGALN